jgi:acetylornithine/N-succinyldiaminopimelate aminotransferase
MLSVESSVLMQFNLKPVARMVRGRGSYLWDEHGRRYLDFVQGWAVNALGHSPALVRDAVLAQLDAVLNPGPAYHNQPSHALAERLAALSGFDRVFLGGSGADANEAAVKLARKWGQRHKQGAFEVITTLDSFHGRTLAMSNATGKPGFADACAPSIAGFPKVPFGDLEAVARAIGERTVAVMVEPIQGEAGAVTPPAGYLRGLRALCDRAGILLIVDEVQTGMARTGPLFAHQHEDVRPDLMTLGKSLGAGLPISALLAREQVACFELGDHGGTFCAHAVLSAAALAVVEHISSRAHSALRKTSAQALESALRGLAERHGAKLRGAGHLWGVVLPSPRSEQVRDHCFAAGLLINAPRPDVLRLMPALDVGGDEIAAMRELLDAALSA